MTLLGELGGHFVLSRPEFDTLTEQWINVHFNSNLPPLFSWSRVQIYALLLW